MADPSLDDQRAFWDAWNADHRAGALDAFTARQAAQADRVARSLARRLGRPLAILDAGCGIGWLGAALAPHGRVTGTDLSHEAVEMGRSRYPAVRFIAGDFATADLGGPYDLVVSADAIAHVADQAGFVARVADVLRPGGVFLLMTQNPFVWTRSSILAPRGAGQLRDWPSLGRLRHILAPSFRVTRVGSIVPGGDQGVLRVSAWALRGAAMLRLSRLVVPALEHARIGRELVITATRR